VIQYALDSATNMLKARKDWGAIGDLHGEFLKRKPVHQLAPIAVVVMAKNKAREGKGQEGTELLVAALKPHIANPENEQVEFLIDELVKIIVPKKKTKDLDADELDRQLVGILDKIIAGQENATTTFRTFYARARLAQLLKRNDRADLYLKGIALNGAKDPAALSPRLLEICGDILLKLGDLDSAEAMYKRLRDHFPNALNGDAGAVGLGYVALARKQPEAALKIFDNALANIPGMSRFKEASLGKLQALVELNQLDAAEKLAEEILNGGKQFRGDTAGKASLLLARIYRKQAAKAEGEKARNLLKMAHGLYIRVFITYKGFPYISAEGIWEASEVAGDLGDEELRKKNRQDLLNEPKLEGTEFFKKAAEEAK
jgi:tetratricopeptide (TPR) repeat protein